MIRVWTHAILVGSLPCKGQPIARRLAMEGLPWAVWYRDGWRASVAGIGGRRGWSPDTALARAESEYQTSRDD